MKYYVIFGPPGAGKGTQSEPMVKDFNLCHISTGDLLRAEIAAGTELGKKAAELIDAGNFVPDEVVEKMIKSRFENAAPGIEGFLLDGFPRTLSQAQDLDRVLAERGEYVTGVISLSISDALIHERITHRATIEGRPDDADEETINNRIRTYHAKTEPIIDYYKKQGCFYDIDGDGGKGQDGIAVVYGRVKKVMNMLHKNEYFQKAWEYLRNNDLSKMEPGKRIFEEGKLWLMINDTKLKKPEDAKMEAHNTYIDIQIPLSCPESFGLRKRVNCNSPMGDFNTEKDIIFYYDAPEQVVTLQPGQPIVFRPEDGHAPQIGEGPIVKAIFKVLDVQ